jgi:hypothetical protein
LPKHEPEACVTRDSVRPKGPAEPDPRFIGRLHVPVHSCAAGGLRVRNHPIHQGSACACDPKALFDEHLLDHALKTRLLRRIDLRVQECERRKTHDLASGIGCDNDFQSGFWTEAIVFEVVVYQIRIWLCAIVVGVNLH